MHDAETLESPPVGMLYDPGPARPSAATAATPSETPRLRRPERAQGEMRVASLDELLPPDHMVRVVWDYVSSVDITPLLQQIKAVSGQVGRDATDPRLLLALWLYATIDGIGSARTLDTLCREHLAYQWLCGGVSLNYHTLADFRSQQTGFLDQLLTDSVAALMHEGLVSLNRVAQDGVRVRASAGAASFRREATLEECYAEAQEQVRQLRAELESDPGASSQRQRSARERAVRERSERIGQALERVRELEKKRQEQAGKEGSDKPPEDGPGAGSGGQGDKKARQPRGSTTDPEARVMKMADGGFRPALNVQFVTDTGSQIITAVDVSNSGSDMGQMAPMVQQHQERYGQRPQEVLVDGGFVKQEDIEQVSAPGVGVTVFAPVRKPKTEGQDPRRRQRRDSDAIAAWRERMGTDEAKEIYKERASTAECVNALARNRGLRQFLVRGIQKARAVALWFALAHNLFRASTLRAAAALRAPGALVSV
jgi:transposase